MCCDVRSRLTVGAMWPKFKSNLSLNLCVMWLRSSLCVVFRLLEFRPSLSATCPSLA